VPRRMVPNTIAQVCVPDPESSSIHGKSETLAQCLRLGPQFHLTLQHGPTNAFGGQFRFMPPPRRYLDTDASGRGHQTQDQQVTNRKIQSSRMPCSRNAHTEQPTSISEAQAMAEMYNR
jgi:hypothetical protein